MSEQQLNECPICMDNIEDMCNKVITECGHIFHCSCLMKNVNHNGFKCPCCRSKMADESDGESDDESDGESDEERIEFGENVLTSFRMFHQQINGEELEEEPEEIEEVEEVEEPEEPEEPKPDATYVSQKLIECGITFEDLVKNILYQEHNNDDYERRSAEVYGKFRSVISQFTRRSIRIASAPPPLIPISTILSSYNSILSSPSIPPIPSSHSSPPIPSSPSSPPIPSSPYPFRIIRATPSSPRFGTNFNEWVIMDEAEHDEL
jgi:hypothetical protein